MQLEYFIDTMTDIMRPNSTVEEPDPWEESPFKKLYNATDISDRKAELILQNAEKIRDKVLSSGSIAKDEAVEPAMGTLESAAHQPDSFYYRHCGPTAATAENVEWNTAFRIDPEEALEYRSDGWNEIASEFRIPDSRTYELVPKKIRVCYRTLEEYTERNDCVRYIHPEAFRWVGPQLTRNGLDYAMDYLSEFPGVIAPDPDKPAWEHTETDTADAEDTATATEEAVS